MHIFVGIVWRNFLFFFSLVVFVFVENTDRQFAISSPNNRQTTNFHYDSFVRSHFFGCAVAPMCNGHRQRSAQNQNRFFSSPTSHPPHSRRRNNKNRKNTERQHQFVGRSLCVASHFEVCRLLEFNHKKTTNFAGFCWESNLFCFHFRRNCEYWIYVLQVWTLLKRICQQSLCAVWQTNGIWQFAPLFTH